MSLSFPASPTIGQVFQNWVWTGSVWAAASGGTLPLPGYLSGLTLSNDATTPATVLDIGTGAACSNDNTTMMPLVTALTKKLNAVWAVGSGNGGLDIGAVAASTWYHVFLIMRPDTGLVDVLFSLSATAPTMPTNYTKKRRIGSIMTDASAHIWAFTQLGDEFLWIDPTLGTASWIFSNAAISTTPTLFGFNVPPGVKVIVIIDAFVATSAANNLTLRSPDQTINSTVSVNLTGNTGAIASAGQFRIRSNTSGQINVNGSAAAAGGLYMGNIGWVDNRGK